MKNINIEEHGLIKNNLPIHVAVIMDGNGRWATQRKKPIVDGHTQGIASVREMVESCGSLGIKFLTLYTFSEENWQRPPAEIKAILTLLEKHLEKELPELNRNNVAVQFIGRLSKFPPSIKQRMDKALTSTSHNTGLQLTLALSYSGRAEIIDAIHKITGPTKRITENSFRNYLYAPKLPDPDLLIRTSGEQRVSNFFLYQLAYTEIYTTPILWPDFKTPALIEALQWYQQRNRRFGRR
ncbi:MAG: polyprenyl diphosphate synthase [bacterium]|nr:polyprenyl diphosphate synthase [bacterium]